MSEVSPVEQPAEQPSGQPSGQPSEQPSGQPSGPATMAANKRPTASIRDADDRPLDRDEYAEALAEQSRAATPDQRLALLGEGEATAVAALLDELAGIYPNEDLGRLARNLALRLHDRLGI